MQKNLEDIKDCRFTHDDYLHHMFRTLMKSTNVRINGRLKGPHHPMN